MFLVAGDERVQVFLPIRYGYDNSGEPCLGEHVIEDLPANPAISINEGMYHLEHVPSQRFRASKIVIAMTSTK